MSNTATTAPKFNAASFIAELEALLGPVEDLIAKHSTGNVQTVAVTAETLTPILESVINPIIGVPAAAQ